ncbi:MAG TPA: hypothetical protein VE619_05465, partial [Nitrososphaeraceae archaeon]|nr:hypothetical protein [Nitrososphaeraceae archaeon]
MRFNKGLNNSHNDDETGSSTRPFPPHTFDSSSTTYFHEIYGKDFTDNNRLVIIDRLKVDEKSRLTLTKNAKHLLDIQPKDEVIMYHDVVNNHIILKIRRRGIGIGEAVLDDIVDSWILKRNAIVGYTFDRNHGKGSSKNNDIIVEKKYDSGFLGMRGDKSNNNSISDIQQYRQQQGEENIKKVPSINIMLIDDEKDVLSAFKTALSSLGYNVEAFVNPQEALQHFLVVINTYKDSPKSYYKLVITDIR